MNRIARTDATLEALSEERDHLAIQISLLDNSETPDPVQLVSLRDKLFDLERRISRYKPADA